MYNNNNNLNNNLTNNIKLLHNRFNKNNQHLKYNNNNRIIYRYFNLYLKMLFSKREMKLKEIAIFLKK